MEHPVYFTCNIYSSDFIFQRQILFFKEILACIAQGRGNPASPPVDFHPVSVATKTQRRLSNHSSETLRTHIISVL